MSFADRARVAPGRRSFERSYIDDLLDRLEAESPDEAAALLSMLADRAWTHAAVAKAICEEGGQVTGQTVGRWRDLYLPKRLAHT